MLICIGPIPQQAFPTVSIPKNQPGYYYKIPDVHPLAEKDLDSEFLQLDCERAHNYLPTHRADQFREILKSRTYLPPQNFRND